MLATNRFEVQNSEDQASDAQAPLAIAEQVTQALERAAPVLEQVERDLEKARQLRGKLGPEGLDNRYSSLLDRYLPQLQTFAYISRDRPSVIGRVYQLNLELSAVSDLVADPLEVLVGASDVNDTFSKIIEDSRELAQELQLLERETQEKSFSSEEMRRDISETIRLMERGSRLLEQSTTGLHSETLIRRAGARQLGPAPGARLHCCRARLGDVTPFRGGRSRPARVPLFSIQFRSQVSDAARHTRDGGWSQRSRLDHRRDGQSPRRGRSEAVPKAWTLHKEIEVLMRE